MGVSVHSTDMDVIVLHVFLCFIVCPYDVKIDENSCLLSWSRLLHATHQKLHSYCLATKAPASEGQTSSWAIAREGMFLQPQYESTGYCGVLYTPARGYFPGVCE